VRPEALEAAFHSDTLLAVVIGAVLATLSGFAATQFEAYLKRRERQRDAALLFGELLSTLRILLNNAAETRGRGDPYGAITLRMLRAVRREIDLYDRNRQSLYDLRDADLRVRLHSLMVRTAMPLDGVLDASDELAPVADLEDPGPRLAALRVARDQGFDFLIANAKEIPALVAALAIPAHHNFVVPADAVPGPGALPGPTGR
jgi:hypothetical protein